MDGMTIGIIVAVVVLVICVIAIVSNYTASKHLYFKLMASYGVIKNCEFTYEEFNTISHYFKNTIKDGEFFIDDITWNDLGMDELFLMINNTNSSIGRDYLYKILRTPTSDKEILAERKRLIEYFNNHSGERTSIMTEFHKVGFNKKLAVTDYIDRLLSLKPSSNLIHYFLMIFIVLMILYAVLVDPVTGILFILVSVGMSIIIYYKMKSRIDSFFSCIRQIVAMLDTAKNISKLNIPELSEYNEVFTRISHEFRKTSRNSWLLVNSKENSGSIADILLEYMRMFTHMDLIKFNIMLRHIGKNKEDLYLLIDRLGTLEAMISVASFRHLLPYYCEPEFHDSTSLNIEEVYHLAIREPVPNSINVNKPVLLTGSNASGKSTFLKSVAINSLLAQSIYTCPCKSYSAPFYRIYSSMALTDNLDGGESYYIVEIKSLKRIIDAAKQSGSQILCFIDEVLRGTNTVERIAASSQILENLANDNVMCFAATHDIELTALLEKDYANYHFTEEVINNQVVFSYEIHEGKATSRNAIKLLEIIGYDKDIIAKAENSANEFINTGKWQVE